MADEATATRPSRNTAVDAMRYGLAFVVVLLHSLPSAQQVEYPGWAAFISITCRVSVPFFFITSGYFLKPAARLDLSVVFKPLQRLLPIYLFWMLAYFIFLQLVPIQHWSFSLRDLISGGTAFHLWFLPALGFALVLVSGGIGLIGMRLTGALCLALAVFGVLRGSYHDALHLSGTAQRGGLFIAPLFVYIGVLVRTHNWSLGRLAIPAILASYLALFLEEWVIYRLSAAPTFSSHDFDAATYLVGLSCFLAVRQMPASAVIDRIAWFGRLSLSVYAGHVFFLWMLAPWIGNDAIWRVAVLAVLCFGLATLLSLALLRIPGLRRVVS